MVDVGYKGAGIHRLYPAYPGWDVLLLTHNDHDHIGDIEDFLGSTAPAVREIWMPYEWRLLFDVGRTLVDRLVGKEERPREFDDVRDARTKIADAIGRIRHALDSQESDGNPDWLDSDEADSSLTVDESAAFDDVYTAVDVIGRAAIASLQDGDNVDWADDLVDAASSRNLTQEPSSADVSPFPKGPIPLQTIAATVVDEVRRSRHHRRVLGTPNAVAGSVTAGKQNQDGRLSATRAAATVMAVRAAQRSGSRLRWFSIDHAERFPELGPHATAPWHGSGIPGVFTIVNAWPVRPWMVGGAPSTVEGSIVFALALATITMQNRRALVALGHPYCSQQRHYWHHPGGYALFSSDSGFEFDILKGGRAAALEVPWHLIGTVVGMHHGSASRDHDHAYESLCESVAIGRSGSVATSRTNHYFAAHPIAMRGCTWCHIDNDQSWTECTDRTRDVIMELSGNSCHGWEVVAGSCIDCPRFQ